MRDQLDDSGKRAVELRNGRIEISQIPRCRINDVGNLIHTPDFGPEILAVPDAQTVALRAVGRRLDMIEQDVALIDGLDAAVFSWDQCVCDVAASPNAGAKFGLLGLSPDDGRVKKHK